MRVRGGYRQSGFTLIEILVAMALMMILFGMLLYPIVQSMRYFRTTTARADAQTVARNALDTMAREISEAMYVQLDMEDNSVIAFIPPLRVDPSDPTSEIVTPPRPAWDHAVRFWRALNNATIDYSAGSHLAAPNTYFLARTVVPEPFTEDDPWNPRNLAWATAISQDGDRNQGVTNWAPIPRVVSLETDVYPDYSPQDMRRNTMQPGYPFLAMKYLYGSNPTEFARHYRDAVVGLTPSGEDYDVRSLSFEPMVVSGEWLTAAQGKLGPDKSTYIARYPLWRLGTALAGWSSLSEYLPVPITSEISNVAYDPFLLIYRYHPAADAAYRQYILKSVCWFDRRSRSMRVWDVTTDGQGRVIGGHEVYDTYAYPFRSSTSGTAFDVDWMRGTVRFEFPPYTQSPNTGLSNEAASGTYDRPVRLEPPDGQNRPLTEVTVGARKFYDAPLQVQWKWRTDASTAFEWLLMPETVTVQVDTNGDNKPDRTLKRVERLDGNPRDYSDEYGLGIDPDIGWADLPQRLGYGCIRLPEHLAGSEVVADYPDRIWVYFRWRSNGMMLPSVMEPGGSATEYPDLVAAYYRTAAVIDIGITVARADVGRTTATGERVSQSVHMTRRVKLPNAVREVHNVEP
jgi:prepilin-type N-terminal cleavage/methylation domain-containing protein